MNQKNMSKTLAVMLMATLAIAVAAVTTTMQTQPAYSQTSHCVENVPPPGPPSSTCITPGQNPTQTICIGGQGQNCVTTDITHQEAGQAIGQQHQDCAEGVDTADVCTVRHP